jgi:hypothetical protein
MKTKSNCIHFLPEVSDTKQFQNSNSKNGHPQLLGVKKRYVTSYSCNVRVNLAWETRACFIKELTTTTRNFS